MIILFLLLYGIMVRTLCLHKEGIDGNYLSKENTQVIKGIFIIIVFLSHIRAYAAYSTISDQFVISILSYLGQLMVAMFLFCSGYGIYESIKRKGESYICSFPKNRIGKTYFDFSLAIFLFLLLNFLIGKNYSIKTIVLSFIGWESVGNSAWYMFAIFTLYIIVYVCFTICRKNNFFAIVLVSVLSLLYVYVMSKVKENWWSVTYLCFVFGMWYSYFNDWLNKLLKKCKTSHYCIILIGVSASYFILSQYRYRRIMAFNIASIAFCLLIVVLMMKISFKSKILSWCGENLFWIYILQRIPMIFFQHVGLNHYNKYIYLYVCVLVTGILTIVMSEISRRLKQKMWK